MAADETAVLLNISDMIDLAIGTPEVGVVDFNMLQTVLHCLAQQLRILGKNVELRGSVATLPVGRENNQTIAISEFIVDTDDKAAPTKAEIHPSPSGAEQETILVVERVKKSESPTDRSPPRDRSPTPQSRGGAATPGAVATPAGAHGAPGAHGTPAAHGAGAPHALSSTEKLSLVTLSKFNLLESTVEDLKNRVYGSMPKNEEILEEVRSQTNLKAITDMWTSLNVSSRLEAAEAGISKLSSLVQDIISETSELQAALKRRESKTLAPAAGPAATAAAAPAGPAPVSGPGQGVPSSLSPTDLKAIQASLDQLRADVDQLSNAFYSSMGEGLSEYGPPTSGPEAAGTAPGAAVTAPGAAGTAPGAAGTAPAPAGTAPGAAGIAGHEASEGGHAVERPRRTHGEGTGALTERINKLEKRMKECCDKIGAVDSVVQDNINSFQDQLEHMMKQVAALTMDPGSGGVAGLAGAGAGGKMSPDAVKDLQGLMQLFQTVQGMQEELKQVHETALHLAAEKEDRQLHVNALLEQIELLKTVKLDREDMIEAMAEKADLRMLARKVSHDQFELACDDLSRGLEHALGKLNMQEALWQQALDDIQREIETKLDKMELSPVKDFFNNKLKQLQENLKQMSSLRREAEAAGTKKRLLRDVNCISCDAQAVMPMEAASAMPVSKPLPATLSMKPYLSYELDAIRKTQASNIPQRNMHDWETIDKQASSTKQPQKVRSDTDKHLCNRYCGGSHTVTTPAQRVARLGHFIKQWGPDVLPLSSGLAAGDDGRMYKVSPSEGVSVGPGGAVEATCTPKSPMKKAESPKPAQKPVAILTECRCLDGEQLQNPN